MNESLLEHFEKYRREYTEACRSVLKSGQSASLDEAAFPAYTHPNPLINHLFWERIRSTVRYLDKIERKVETAVDFGCGGGVMGPFLAKRAHRVILADLDTGPVRSLSAIWPLPPNVEIIDLRAYPLEQLTTGSADIVLALDVLEHVSDLDSTVRELLRILRGSGQLIVSGPTENPLYRLGRRLAGPEYHGSYHVRNIDCIGRAIAAHRPVRRMRTIYPWLPLFRLLRTEGNEA